MPPLRVPFVLSLCLLLCAGAACARTIGKGAAVSEELPPPRPATMPAFHAPEPGEREGMSLDEPWQFMQYLYDADTTQPNYQSHLNAVPVQFAFCHSTSGFLATLHTVFETTNCGRTWRNLDPFPEPAPSHSDWMVLRSPMYISALAARPVLREGATTDTVLISAYSGISDSGNVHLIYYSGGHHLYPGEMLSTPVWITTMAIPDSLTAIALGGMNGRLWENDTLNHSYDWAEMNTNRVFLRSGRDDSLRPTQTWVATCISLGQKVIAVGSHHWVSEDHGLTWHIRPAADSLFDSSINFCDSLHGIVGGGSLSPNSHGWVHVTTDGGQTWSGRTLETPFPIRAVVMVTPQIGYAAGGNYAQGAGRLYSTTDGGQTWALEMTLGAEIRTLTAIRASTAYVNVLAGGVFPDFRGGIWRTQIYLPDSSHALLVANPDTLDFGTHPAGQRDTLTLTIRNIGVSMDTILAFSSSNPRFIPQWNPVRLAMHPGQQFQLRVAFTSDSNAASGPVTGYLTVQNMFSGQVEVFCTAQIALSSPLPRVAVPQRPGLTVYPNPGNASFEIRYDLALAGNVLLRVYDLNGRVVETLAQSHASPGAHVLTWNAAEHASGLYFVRLNAEDTAVTRKVLLLK